MTVSASSSGAALFVMAITATTRSYTRSTRALQRRGTRTCDSRASRKCSRTSASSASPLPLERMPLVCRSPTFTPTARKEHSTMQTVAITPNAVPQEVPLSLLMESATNPRQHFEEDDLNELADTIRKSGVYQAILARPKEDRLEIVFGARRYRASQLAGRETIPALVREMSDAEVLEAQLVENLQRRDVHPMEEAEGYKRLLALTEPTYTVEQIAAKVGKTPVYIATRLKLTDLCDEVAAAFYQNHIGVGHALLLAKLPA